jgi:hypothetical protein
MIVTAVAQVGVSTLHRDGRSLRKLFVAATALMLTAVGAWAVSTTHARVEAPAGVRIDPSQIMTNATDLPIERYDDYALVYN